MSKSIRSFSDVIAAFGGPTKFAEAIGIPDFHAQSMKNRDSIPDTYWADTVAAAKRAAIPGVTLEKLAALAKAKGAERRQRRPAHAVRASA